MADSEILPLDKRSPTSTYIKARRGPQDWPALEHGMRYVIRWRALGGNWCYSCGRVERVEKGDTVEIANTHAGFVHVAENILTYAIGRGEYPTLSAIFL
jgi:hypothetical protein